MIYGYLHQGSGLGNQLHRIVATQIKALELNTDWRMIYNPDNSNKVAGFKGKDFIKFDENKILYDFSFWDTTKIWNEKKIIENGIDIRGYDPEWNFIQDNTVIEGEFQDERYWKNYEKEINKWLRVKPLNIPEDLCLIGFRGGEYSIFPDLFLSKEYWNKGLKRMLEINPNMRFEVHTDDEVLAKQFFPKFPIVHNVEINWRSMRFAKYAIIANSSFYILPRWLRHKEEAMTIAPRFWSRHNIGIWALPQNFYSRFSYI